MTATDPQIFITIIVCYILFVILLAYILLAGDAKCHRGTIISKAHNFCIYTLPSFCQNRLLSFLCGSQVRAKYISENFSIFFEKRLMPAAYLMLLFGGLAAFQLSVIPRLDELQVFTKASICPRSRFFCHQSTGLSFPPRTPQCAVLIYLICSLASWFMVMYTDPGTITSTTHSHFEKVYPPDNILFSQDAKECSTCHLKKLPRSKHCSLCNRCVARFDHHCGWVATCVGIYNIPYFLNFLLVHSIMTVHGSLVAAELIRAKVQKLIAGRYIFVPTNSVIDRFSFRVAFVAETTLCAVFLVVILAGLMVMFFLFYHISLVVRNVTTNEAAKWSTVRDTAKDYQIKHGTSIGTAMTAEITQANQEIGEQNDNERDAEILPRFDEKGLPVNIYNNGIIKNFAEVLSPHRFVRLRTCNRDKVS